MQELLIIGYFPLDFLPHSMLNKVETTSDSVRRESKSNFSDIELSCMVENYAQHAAIIILQCKLSNFVTNKRKKQI